MAAGDWWASEIAAHDPSGGGGGAQAAIDPWSPGGANLAAAEAQRAAAPATTKAAQIGTYDAATGTISYKENPSFVGSVGSTPAPVAGTGTGMPPSWWAAKTAEYDTSGSSSPGGSDYVTPRNPYPVGSAESAAYINTVYNANQSGVQPSYVDPVAAQQAQTIAILQAAGLATEPIKNAYSATGWISAITGGPVAAPRGAPKQDPVTRGDAQYQTIYDKATGTYLPNLNNPTTAAMYGLTAPVASGDSTKTYSVVNPYDPLYQPGRYSKFQKENPEAAYLAAPIGGPAYEMAIRAETTKSFLDPNVQKKAVERGYRGGNFGLLAGMTSEEAAIQTSKYTRSTVAGGKMVTDESGRTRFVADPNRMRLLPDAQIYYGAPDSTQVKIPKSQTWLDTIIGDVVTTVKSPGGVYDIQIAGGGRDSAQSGTISTKPMSTVIRNWGWEHDPKGGINLEESVKNYEEVLATPHEEKYHVGAALSGGIGGQKHIPGLVLTTNQDPRVADRAITDKEVASREQYAKANTAESPLLFTGTLPTTGVTLGGVAQYSMLYPKGSGSLANLMSTDGTPNVELVDRGYETGNVLTDRHVGFVRTEPTTLMVRPEPVTRYTNPFEATTTDTVKIGGIKEVPNPLFIEGVSDPKNVAKTILTREPDTTIKGGEKYFPAITNDPKYGLAYGSSVPQQTKDQKAEAWRKDLLYNINVKERVADKTRELESATQRWDDIQGWTVVPNLDPYAGKVKPNVGGVSGEGKKAQVVSMGMQIPRGVPTPTAEAPTTPAKASKFGAAIIPGGAGLGFGVQAADEGTVIKPDYTSARSIESGMEYGMIPKPVVSVSKTTTTPEYPQFSIGSYLGAWDKRIASESTTQTQESKPENILYSAANLGNVIVSAFGTARGSIREEGASKLLVGQTRRELPTPQITLQTDPSVIYEDVKSVVPTIGGIAKQSIATMVGVTGGAVELGREALLIRTRAAKFEEPPSTRETPLMSEIVQRLGMGAEATSTRVGMGIEATRARVGMGFEALRGFATDYSYGLLPPPPATRKSTDPIRTVVTGVSLSGGNETISKNMEWLEKNEKLVDLTDEAAVEEYNTRRALTMEMYEQNPIVETTSTKQVGTPDTTEWQRVKSDTGGWVRENIYGGVSDVDLERERKLAETPGVYSIHERLAYGVKEQLIRDPTVLITAPAQAATFYAVGAGVGALGVAYGGTTLWGASVIRTIATPAVAPASAITKEAIARYGFAHGGKIAIGTYYVGEVTDWGKATPEEIQVNVGRTLPGVFAGSLTYAGVGSAVTRLSPTPPPATATQVQQPRTRGGGGSGGSTISEGAASVQTKVSIGNFNIPLEAITKPATATARTVSAGSFGYGSELPVQKREVGNEVIFRDMYAPDILPGKVNIVELPVKERETSELPVKEYDRSELPINKIIDENKFVNENKNRFVYENVNRNVYENPNANWWENRDRFGIGHPTGYSTPTENKYGFGETVVHKTPNAITYAEKTTLLTPALHAVSFPKEVVYQQKTVPPVRPFRELPFRQTPIIPMIPRGLPSGASKTGGPKSRQFSQFAERFNVGRGISQSAFFDGGEKLSLKKRGIIFGKR